MQSALNEIEHELGIPADPEPVAAKEEEAIEADLTPLVALFQARNVRILGTVEDPLFCAFDVATYIGDVDHYMRTLRKFTSEYVQKIEITNARGEKRPFSFLTEDGVYKYLMQAKGEKAEEFQHFVFKLLKIERRKTVDSIRLALKIARSQTQFLQREKESLIRNEERFCMAANDARTENARLMKEVAVLRKEKLAAENAAYLMSMGRGHLIDDEEDDEGDEGDEGDEEADNGLW